MSAAEEGGWREVARLAAATLDGDPRKSLTVQIEASIHRTQHTQIDQFLTAETIGLAALIISLAQLAVAAASVAITASRKRDGGADEITLANTLRRDVREKFGDADERVVNEIIEQTVRWSVRHWDRTG